MLKTTLLSQAKSLIPAVLLAGFGVISSHQASNAASFDLASIDLDPNGTGQDIYNYNLVIGSGEGLSLLDSVNILGVTAGDFFTAPAGFAGSKPQSDIVQFVYLDGLDPTSPPIQGGTGGLTIPGFKILGNIGSQTQPGSYQFFDNNIGNTQGSTIAGSGATFVPGTITSVPESSNALGLMLIGGIVAASGLRKQLVKS